MLFMSYVYFIKNRKMTHKKTELFDTDLQQLAAFSKVMSHPARLAILRYIAQCTSCISGDISNQIPLSRATVSQHLQELKKAGLIKGEIDGLKINYCICSSCIKDVKVLFEIFFNEISIDQNEKC